MMNSMYDANPEQENVWSRPIAFFIAASVTLLVSLLIPCPPIALDVIWIFALLITCSVTWVCVTVRHSADLIGLASLVSFLTLLRLALQVITAGKIIRQHPSGALLKIVGDTLATSGTLAALWICLLLAAIAVIIVFAACQRITIASNNYLQNVLPLKQIGIETDLQMETIDTISAQTLRHRIACESRFFSGMNGAGLLMRGEAAICIFTLIVCLTMPELTGSLQTESENEYLSHIASSVIALSVFSLVPAVIVSVSCGVLTRTTLACEQIRTPKLQCPPGKL